MKELTCDGCPKELGESVTYDPAGKKLYCSIGCGYRANGDHHYVPTPKFTTLTREEAQVIFRKLER